MKVFIAHSSRDHEFVASIAKQFRDSGHDVFVPVSVKAGEDSSSEISAAIRSANVVVAVVTAANLNVFYELGLASGANVPILITAHSGEYLPSNLMAVPYVQMTGDGLRDAKMIVRRAEDLKGLATARPTSFNTAEATLQAASRDPALLELLAPTDFERLISDLFRERGYHVLAVTPGSDLGADLVLKDEKDGKRVLVEVKKLSRSSRISVETVRKLQGAVSREGASAGLVVSTSGSTAAAFALAAGGPIVLRTLEDTLAAKSMKELLNVKQSDR